MTNTIALCLAVLLIGFFALDYFWLEWETHLLLMRRLAQFTEWLAFWR